VIEERAQHVLRLIVDLGIERDGIHARCASIAAGCGRGEVHPLAKLVGERQLLLIRQSQAWKHQHAMLFDQLHAALRYGRIS